MTCVNLRTTGFGSQAAGLSRRREGHIGCPSCLVAGARESRAHSAPGGHLRHKLRLIRGRHRCARSLGDLEWMEFVREVHSK